MFKVYTAEGFEYNTAYGKFNNRDRANEVAENLREMGVDAFVIEEEA